MVRDKQLIEEKITSEGYKELFYRPEDAEHLIQSISDIHKWLPKNNISMVSHVEDLKKVNITYDGEPPNFIRILFGVSTDHVFCDYYAVEFKGEDITLKIYDRNLINHPLPSLPSGSRIDSHNSGVGVFYSVYSGKSDTRKVYYINDKRFFGLEYNTKTLDQLSLSEYLFSGDISKW